MPDRKERQDESHTTYFKNHVEKLNEEYKELENLIEELHSILASEAKVLSIIKNNLEDIKNKFGDKRRTEISHDLGDINIADLIKKEDVLLKGERLLWDVKLKHE